LMECEKIMRAFLWAGSTDKRRAKVSWARVCSPKDEGSLGLRRVVDCNRATMMRLVWDILTDRSSLWVRWCKAEILKGCSIWRVEPKQSLSVTWKIILNLKAKVSAKLVYSVWEKLFLVLMVRSMVPKLFSDFKTRWQGNL
ncbi:hypothetical protein CFOL_v3_24491, partial [Cephalotus follicularis]